MRHFLKALLNGTPIQGLHFPEFLVEEFLADGNPLIDSDEGTITDWVLTNSFVNEFYLACISTLSAQSYLECQDTFISCFLLGIAYELKSTHLKFPLVVCGWKWVQDSDTSSVSDEGWRFSRLSFVLFRSLGPLILVIPSSGAEDLNSIVFWDPCFGMTYSLPRSWAKRKLYQILLSWDFQVRSLVENVFLTTLSVEYFFCLISSAILINFLVLHPPLTCIFVGSSSSGDTGIELS